MMLQHGITDASTFPAGSTVTANPEASCGGTQELYMRPLHARLNTLLRPTTMPLRIPV